MRKDGRKSFFGRSRQTVLRQRPQWRSSSKARRKAAPRLTAEQPRRSLGRRICVRRHAACWSRPAPSRRGVVILRRGPKVLYATACGACLVLLAAGCIRGGSRGALAAPPPRGAMQGGHAKRLVLGSSAAKRDPGGFRGQASTRVCPPPCPKTETSPHPPPPWLPAPAQVRRSSGARAECRRLEHD